MENRLKNAVQSLLSPFRKNTETKEFYNRMATKHITKALTIRPVVLITGPRQVGKTTLAKKICQNQGYKYVNLEVRKHFRKAKRNPDRFIQKFNRVIIDEIQRVPELILSIKTSVDNNRQFGRFLLTGSSNIILNERLPDSLAGRMRRINLLPLSQAELIDTTPTFLNRLFAEKFECEITNYFLRDDLIQKVLVGGFPETIAMDANDRGFWHDDYLDSVLRRDLEDIAVIDKLTTFSDLVTRLSIYAGKLVNYTRLSSDAGLNINIAKQYVSILEQMYLVKRLQPWYRSALKTIANTPKMHFLDTGLLTTIRGYDFKKLRNDRTEFGSFLENFVFSEIWKLVEESVMRLNIYTYRDNSKFEVDILLERNDGKIAGIEVKASDKVQSSDFKGMQNLKEVAGDNFVHGVVLYDGTEIKSFGDQMTAVPLSALWS